MTLKDFVPYGWIIPPRPEPDRLKLDALFASAGLPRPVATAETTSAVFQAAMVAGSPWLSYLPRSSIFVQSTGPRFAPPGLCQQTWSRTICAVFRRQGLIRPTVISFLKELEKVCHEANGER